MRLQYILGGSSSGKTKRIINDIITMLGTDYNLIYIVPEQFSLQSENDLIEAAHGQGILQVQVLSFNRLSYHIFSEVGFNREKTVDSVGKNMLLRKIAISRAHEFSYYTKSVNRHGFIEDISQMITELYQNDITVEALNTYSAMPQLSQNLHRKLLDIAKIFEDYSKYMQEQGLSADDVLSHLAKVMDNSSYIKNSYIWIDGFYGFTPQEISVISRLIANAKKVSVALTLNENLTKFYNIQDTDIFSETKHTINSITSQAEELRTVIEENIFLGSPKRFSGVHISSSINYYEEVENAAAQILYLTRDKGFRYRDIGIAVTQLDVYGKIIKGIFNQYEIPVFIDTKMDILSHPLTELIRALLDIAVTNWSYESVFRFLKTGIVPIEKEELYDLENYCLAYGIKHGKWNYDEWTAGFQDDTFDSIKINSSKDLVKSLVKPFTESVRVKAGNRQKIKKGLTVREISVKVFDVLDKLNVTAVLSQWIEEAYQNGDNLNLRRHKQIWGLICHVFDKITEIMGDEAVTIKEYAQIMDSGLESVDMGLIPPSRDQIIAGDIERSRFPEIKTLLILGMNEGVLVPSESGVLDDDERKFLKSHKMNLSPDIRQRMLRQELYLAGVFAKPTDYLCISYSTGNLEGRALYPAVLVDKIKADFPKSTESFLPEDFIGTKTSMLRELGIFLANARNKTDIGVTGRQLLNYYSRDSHFSEVIDTMKQLTFGKSMYENLQQETVTRLYGTEIISNVSRLEKFVQCPFAYFVRYNLEAGERNIYQVDYVDLGNLFHEILEEFSKFIEIYQLSWKTLDISIIDKLVEEALENIRKNDKRDILGSSASNKYLLERVSRVAKKSIWALSQHIIMGSFEPYGAEMAFKSEAITEISINAGGTKKFILSGRIDRVDIMDFDGNIYVKIIDYKSGSIKFSPDDIYYGMQLQLMLYLDHFIKITKTKLERLPGGIFYFNINDPILNYEDLNIDFENFEEFTEKLNEKILTEFKLSGLMLADVDIAKGFDEEIENNPNKWSRVIGNVQLSNSGETGFSKSSAVATLDEFNMLRKYANQKITGIGADILSGNININPYKKDKYTGCDYCAYSAVCQFDLIVETGRYRNFKKFGSFTEMMETIYEECGGDMHNE